MTKSKDNGFFLRHLFGEGGSINDTTLRLAHQEKKNSAQITGDEDENNIA